MKWSYIQWKGISSVLIHVMFLLHNNHHKFETHKLCVLIYICDQALPG